MRRLALAALAVVLATLLVAGPAGATGPGRNGKIAFTSGREGADDNRSQIYMVRPDGTGLSAPLGIDGVKNRDASLSPDRTKLVFAAGSPGILATEEYDLYVRDLVTGTVAPLDPAQVGDGLSSGHPAWSPDGTRIAYEAQPVDNSPNRDIWIKTLDGSAPALPLATGAAIEFEPAWTPDGRTLYYTRLSSTPTLNYDIVAQKAEGFSGISPYGSTSGDEYQPSISPDGTQICFTLQTTAGTPATGEIVVARLSNPNDGIFLTRNNVGDSDCSWSPDGKRIAYTHGASGQGALVEESSDGSSAAATPVADDQGSNNFDGEAEWVVDGAPDCEDRAVTTRAGASVTLELECADSGPPAERTDPDGAVTDDGAPLNGSLSGASPLSEPSTVVYTPDPGFTGTDRVIYSASDEAGPGTDRATVTIEVRPGVPCGGRDATIVGTNGADVLRGTAGADVISAGPGDDKVRAGGGRDLICGDAGKDRLAGGGGGDRLDGGSSRDRCSGGPGKDRQSKCEVSR